MFFFFDDAFICSARDLLRPSGGGVAGGFGVAGCLATEAAHFESAQILSALGPTMWCFLYKCSLNLGLASSLV